MSISEKPFRQKDSVNVKSQSANIGKLMEEQSLQSVSQHNQKKSLNADSEAEDYVDRNTGSRATSHRNVDPDRVWTTEEILAD